MLPNRDIQQPSVITVHLKCGGFKAERRGKSLHVFAVTHQKSKEGNRFLVPLLSFIVLLLSFLLLLGCAMQFCDGAFQINPDWVSGTPPKSADMAVCHYAPPGNMLDPSGQEVYFRQNVSGWQHGVLSS
jgi:hypothetical protein